MPDNCPTKEQLRRAKDAAAKTSVGALLYLMLCKLGELLTAVISSGSPDPYSPKVQLEDICTDNGDGTFTVHAIEKLYTWPDPNDPDTVNITTLSDTDTGIPCNAPKQINYTPYC